MSGYTILDYVSQNDVGFGVISGETFSTAKVTDITVDKERKYCFNYEGNLLVKHCQKPETLALIILSEGYNGKVEENAYSAAYVAANIAAKNGKKGMSVIRINKKEGFVEQHMMVPKGHLCQCLDKQEMSLEEFLKKCAANP